MSDCEDIGQARVRAPLRSAMRHTPAAQVSLAALSTAAPARQVQFHLPSGQPAVLVPVYSLQGGAPVCFVAAPAEASSEAVDDGSPVSGLDECAPLLPAQLARSDAPMPEPARQAKAPDADPRAWTEADRDRRDKIAGRWAVGIAVKAVAFIGVVIGAIVGGLLGGGLPGAIAGASTGLLLAGGIAALVGYITGYVYATVTINGEKKAEVAKIEAGKIYRPVVQQDDAGFDAGRDTDPSPPIEGRAPASNRPATIARPSIARQDTVANRNGFALARLGIG